MQNQIPKNWQIEPLSFFTNQVTYGFTNPMPTSGVGPFMVTAKDIIDGRVNYDTCRKTTLSAYENLLTDKSRPELEDILLTKDGTLGRVALVTQVPLCINQSVALIKVNKGKIIPKFLQYLLESPEYQNKMLSEAGGSTIGHIYITRVDKMEIAVPSRSEQEKIVNNIESLDRKIELNNKIAKTLEKMAQVLFKEWFVHFRFPGYEKAEFVENELGRIPKEWNWGTLNDLVNIRNGFAFKSTDYRNQGIPIIRTTNFTDIGSVILDDVVYLSPEITPKYKNFYLEQFDFLLVMVGASVGKWAIMPSNILPALQNQNMWDFIPKTEEYRFFNIYLLKKIIREQKGSTTGSARDFFRKDYFYSLNIFIPDSEILQKFNLLVEPIYKRLDAILGEDQKLAALRDLLLPKLVKGEIRV